MSDDLVTRLMRVFSSDGLSWVVRFSAQEGAVEIERLRDRCARIERELEAMTRCFGDAASKAENTIEYDRLTAEAAAEIERLRGDVEGYAKTIRVLRAKVEAAEAALKTALERIEELEDVSHNAYGPDA